MFRDATSGGCHTFLIPQSCGWTGREIARLLKRRRIASWALMAIDDVFTLSVYNRDARRAQAILDAAGIPVENPVRRR